MEKRKLAKCKSCKKCFRKASARKHISATHRENNVDGLLVDIMVQNRSFISPGNTPLPRKMTQTEERSRKREEEKEKRKRLLKECERNPLFDEERATRTNATVNRDKVMVFDVNGNAQRLRLLR